MILVPVPSTRINDSFFEDDLIDTTPVTQDITHPIIEGEPNEDDYRFKSAFYQKIALDVVTETVFHYPYPCITEKTLRPIACKRMFIIVGPVGVLSFLHSKNFLTFGDLIDESYDCIVDPNQRFNAVIESITKFSNLPISEIQNYYKSNAKKFEHNFQTLQNLRENDLRLACQLLDIPIKNMYNT